MLEATVVGTGEHVLKTGYLLDFPQALESGMVNEFPHNRWERYKSMNGIQHLAPTGPVFELAFGEIGFILHTDNLYNIKERHKNDIRLEKVEP